MQVKLIAELKSERGTRGEYDNAPQDSRTLDRIQASSAAEVKQTVCCCAAPAGTAKGVCDCCRKQVAVPL